MNKIINLAIVLVLASSIYLLYDNSNNGLKAEDSKAQVSIGTSSEPIIKIAQPKNSEHVHGYVLVKGTARVFENQMIIRLKDGDDNRIISEEQVHVASPEIGTYGPWNFEFNINQFKDGKRLIIEALDYSAKDGREIGVVDVPVVVWSDK